MTWKVNDCEYAFYINEGDTEIARIDTQEGGYLNRSTISQARQYANLISAAPDMLKALEAVQPLIAALYGAAQADKAQMVLNAINKAKGV